MDATVTFSAVVILMANSLCFSMFELDFKKRSENAIFKNINDVEYKEFRNSFLKRFNYDFETKKFGTLKPDGKGTTFHEERLNQDDKKLIADYQCLAESRKDEIMMTYNNGKCRNFKAHNCLAGIGAAAIGVWSTGLFVLCVMDFIRTKTKPEAHVFSYADFRMAFLLCGIGYFSYRSIKATLHYMNAGLNYKNYLWRQQQEIDKICNDFNQMQLLVDVKPFVYSCEDIN